MGHSRKRIPETRVLVDTRGLLIILISLVAGACVAVGAYALAYQGRDLIVIPVASAVGAFVVAFTGVAAALDSIVGP